MSIEILHIAVAFSSITQFLFVIFNLFSLLSVSSKKTEPVELKNEKAQISMKDE